MTQLLNTYQQTLFNELLSLTKSNEAFYYQSFTRDNSIYWIFNYRLASYTDFLQPSAIECRGIMFEVDSNGNPIRLAALPMEKFFNLNENPLTMNVDLTTICAIDEKVDGSLMSTYIHNNEVKLKSKGSIYSEQCIYAMNWLNLPAQAEFKIALYDTTRMGFTVNLEYQSPYHRIVIGYPTLHLVVLNVRNILTGQYFYPAQCPTLTPYWVKQLTVSNPVEFVEQIPQMVNVEGYVIRLWSGQRIKIKTAWYLSLHHAKDSVNNPRRLFEVILDEGIDDLRSMFSTDVVAMQMVDEMQTKVNTIYNNMVNMVENFYITNSHLPRKEYAILGQQHFKDTFYFNLAMLKFLDKPINYKEFLKNKWKELGLKDMSIKEVNENN